MGNLNELKNLKENFLEKKGRFQIFLIVILAFNSMSVGINHTITSFYTYIPKFQCIDNENSTCKIGNSTIDCSSGYEFDNNDDKTIVSEYSLVCHNEYVGPLTNTLYFVGVTIGSLLCNMLCDKFGRKKIVIICMYSIVLMSVCLYFGKSLTLFVLFRIIQGIFVQGLQTCTYILIMEYCPSKNRTAAAIFWELNWTFGLMILGVIAYFIRSWRVLTLVMTAPLILSLFYSWLIPESISWLYVNNKYRECLKVIKNIAKKNQDTASMDTCRIVTKNLENDEIMEPSIENDINDDSSKSSTSSGILDVVRSYILRKHLVIMLTVWFSVTLSYYGILYYLPNLSGQRHINFLVGAVVENLAYISSYFVLSNLGRRIPMTFYQISNGIILIIVGFSYFVPESETKGWVVLVLTFIAKGLTVCCFGGMFMYGSELFPTICRGFALGLCCFSARVASLLAPQFMFLATIIPAFIPMTIIGLLICASGLATLLLPETLNSTLPNTIEEAHDVWEKPSKL